MKLWKVFALSLAVASFAGQSAQATTNYTDVIGTSVSFTGINETSTTDPEPLFDQPGGIGNQLLFFPATFSASASGAFGYDETSSLLNLTISGNGPLDTIDQVNISEFGDVTLSGVGTSATGTFAAMAGYLTVTETTGGPIAPVIIPILGVFTPSDTLDLITNPGATLWSATYSVDVTSYVANATVAELQLDNNLFAYSEAGTTATIQKKVVSGPAVIIEVVPEPGTFLMVAGGLLGLAVRSRRRRA